MKRIYYLQKIEVELGDLIAYKGFKTTVTEELIELNPELFRVEKNTQSMYFKCVKGEGNYTKGRIYKQKYSTNYPTAISLTNDKGITENVHYWEITCIKHAYNCFELTTKEEWDKQELLDKAKRDYPIGTVFNNKNGIQKVLSDKPFVGIGVVGNIQINTDKFTGGATIYTPEDGWVEILPLKFTTEDGVNIYGDMKTYAVYSDLTMSIGNTNNEGTNSTIKYFYHKENALAYIEKHKEKTLEDYEKMLFNVHFNIWSWIKVNEPKLYYTKILQLIADDLNDGRYIHIRGNTSYHLSNARSVNVHCGGDEGCVYFKSEDLVKKARVILGDKVKYLFN